MRANLTPQEKQSMLDMLRIASDEILSVLWKTITSNGDGVAGMDPDLLKAFYDEFDRRPGLLESMTESRKRNKMKLTESQARSAIRKWLFEYATDSGVSSRASTDDKIAGKLGDDRENQPASTIPQETPIMAMSQMSTQLTQEMPPIEDPDFVPGTVQELGKSVDLLAQQVPHEEIEWFYDKMQELADEAIEKGSKTNILDDYEPDRKESNPTIQPSSKSSSEATNENWSRWSQMLSKTLNEARKTKKFKKGPKNDPLNLRRRKFTARDIKPTYQDEDDWITGPIGDGHIDPSDYADGEYTGGSYGDEEVGMDGEVVGGEYQPTREELEDMGMAVGRNIEELPGYDSRRHRTNQEVVSQGDGEEAKLRELVNLKIFPNITTMSGMRKMIKNQIDPIVHIWFTANALSKQMTQFIQSSAGQYLFFDALSCSKLFTEDNVLELKGAKRLADGLVYARFVKGRKKAKKVPAKYKKQLATSGKFLRSEVEAFATTQVPDASGQLPLYGSTLSDLLDEYDQLKDQNRKVLMSSGMYSAVMSNIVVAPILRRWAKEVKSGNIDISSSKNKGQVDWNEAGEWLDQEVLQTWSKMGNGRKGKKVEQAMQSQMEFHDAIEAAQEEAEIRAMELEDEGHEVDNGLGGLFDES